MKTLGVVGIRRMALNEDAACGSPPARKRVAKRVMTRLGRRFGKEMIMAGLAEFELARQSGEVNRLAIPREPPRTTTTLAEHVRRVLRQS
jgi:hypothetical protein